MIIIFLIVLIILLFFTQKNEKDEIIQILTRQAARWSLAAAQDQNPLIAVLHANYGAAYLWAIKDIATGSEVKKTTGIDLLTFERKITGIQDFSTINAAKLCPELVSDHDKYLAAIAGEGI